MEQLLAWCRDELERKQQIVRLLVGGTMRISETRGNVMEDTTEKRRNGLQREIAALKQLIQSSETHAPIGLQCEVAQS
jgi:hypothetical protein